jgi:hypothetical protein
LSSIRNWTTLPSKSHREADALKDYGKLFGHLIEMARIKQDLRDALVLLDKLDF